MENLNKKWVIYTLIGIIISPILISILCNLADLNQIKLFNAGDNSDWISFWGSMLGAVFGVIGTFLILQIQIRKDNERFEQTQIDNTFFNMLELFQKVQDDMKKETFTVLDIDFDENSVPKKINIDVDVFIKILDEISIEKKEYLEQKKSEYIQNKFEEIDKELKNEIKANINEVQESIGLTDYASIVNHVYYILKNTLDAMEENSFVKFNDAVNGLGGVIRNRTYMFGEVENLKIKKALEMNAKLMTTQEEYEYPFQEEEIFNIIDECFSNYQSNIGNYLRVFHRLVKQIMSSQLGMEKKKEYLGIIRALLSSKELLVIFYNTFYSTRGKGLREQLSIKDKKNNKTEFFADKVDLSNFNINQENGTIDLPFFKYEDLIFKNNDFSHVQELSNE